MPTRLELALEDLTALFDTSDVTSYTRSDLASVLRNSRSELHLAQKTTVNEFIQFLVNHTKMEKINLQSSDYPKLTRYFWGRPSPFQVALSIRGDSYLTHTTAVFLHGLSDQLPQMIYVNREQSPKPQTGSITQEGLNRAFARPQRRSKYIYEYNDWKITILSGKSTGNLGVATVAGPNGETLPVTGIERTLIDLVVRPTYSGGIYHVLDVYKTAKEKMSVSILLDILKKLDYSYPYHQTIGFYMQRAGYEEVRWSRLKQSGLKFDFYLAHDIRDRIYNSEWRLFIPKNF